LPAVLHRFKAFVQRGLRLRELVYPHSDLCNQNHIVQANFIRLLAEAVAAKVARMRGYEPRVPQLRADFL